MSYTLYHGCVESAVELIVTGKYGVEESTPIVHPWLCADGNDIFFYDKELMKEEEYLDEDDDEGAIQYCLERCNEQAQIQNACLPHPFDVTCVLEITFHTDGQNNEVNTWEDLCVPDNSCDNNGNAVCMSAEDFNEFVSEGKVSFKIHKYEFFPKLALCYISYMPVENPLFNQSCLTEGELKACKIIMDSGLYVEEIHNSIEVDCYEVLPLTFRQ